MKVVGRLTTIPDDVPVPDGTSGEIRRLIDNELVDTVTTTNGDYEHEQNGSPGPFRIDWDIDNVQREQYSTITGPSGAVDVASIPLVFRAFTDGVLDGVGNELAVTASGSNMNISIATGAALVKGILYDHITSSSITVSTADGTNPRIDRLVVRVVPPDNTEEGRSELVLKVGAPAASPTAPTLTQTNAVWEISLATILVGTGVLVIGSDKVTDTRDISRPNIPADTITSIELASGAVATDNIQNHAVGGSQIADGAVSTTKIADATVTEAKLAAAVVTKLNTVTDAAPVLMPGSEYVATGAISSGTRTLATLAVGPLESGVTYAILLYHGVTLRNDYTTGTVIVRANINGGTQRTHEFQNVGGVPRWAPVIQTAAVVGAGGSINVTGSVQHSSGDATSIRAGWLQVIALPLNVAIGL